MENNKKSGSVTQTDIAKELNISVVSVSNALSGKRGVSDELRQRILDTADEMGYKRNEKKEVKQGKTSTIGVVISERYLGGFASCYMNIYREIVLAAQEKKLITILEVLAEEEEQDMKLPELFYNEEIEGILILGEVKEEYTRILRKESRVPIIFVDYYRDIPETDFVISDGYYGTYQITKKVLESDYTKVAFVGNIYATSSIMDRFLGFRRAMMERNMTIRPEWIIEDRKLWRKELDVELPKEMPEVFVCNCDKTASIVIHKVRERGYRVPEDIGVTGFDHFLAEEIEGIKLLTYDVDMQAMARISVNILKRKMASIDFSPKLRIVSGKLISGSSCILK